MGHFADFCHEIVGGEQLHTSTYEIMDNEEDVSNKEERHEALEE